MTSHSIPTSARTADFDVFTATSRIESNTCWDVARDAAPVLRSDFNGGLWMLTRYEEVCAAFRDWETFSSARTDPALSSIAVTQGKAPLLVPEELDPPDWDPYRRIIAELLTPRVAEAELSLECRALATVDLDPAQFLDPAIGDLYPRRDYHRVFIGQILGAWAEDPFVAPASTSRAPAGG